MTRPVQSPAPGSRIVRHAGDLLEFSFVVPGGGAGHAWLRTTLGHAAVRRAEIVAHVENGQPMLAREWHDVAMRRVGHDRFTVTLPLLDAGCHEAKALFLPDGRSEPVWPEGGNALIKVEPASTVCANSVYTAFVRQFRPDADAATDRRLEPGVRVLEEQGYTVIPRSGTFRDLIGRLDVIVGRMGFRIVQLLPIHPTPTVFGRMGRFGSPFAGLDYLDVDPALAEFDRQTTPLEQFCELVSAVHARGALLFLDIPVNHTGWASKLQNQHPEWFDRNDDRTFRSPGAWGVTWEDLSQLDFRVRHLWGYVAGIFLTWCSRGVDGFRCDAGYMLPGEVWTYIVAKVRQQYPDTIFLLEGLGGKLEKTCSLLSPAGLNWAYSELFQQPDRQAIERYLPDVFRISRERGVMVHFAETHDNDRLAARSVAHARMRTSLSALFSDAGGFGITAGLEWYAREKIDVHGAPSLNWGASDNQVGRLARLNRILAGHPAFSAGVELRLVQRGGDNVLAMLRHTGTAARDGLVVANLDVEAPARAVWLAVDWDAPGGIAFDLVENTDVALTVQGAERGCELGPGAVMCLVRRGEEAGLVPAAEGDVEPPLVGRQRLRTKALEIVTEGVGPADLSGLDVEAAADALARDPRAYCTQACGGLPRVTEWRWPADVRRTVVLPAGHFLLVRAPRRFCATVQCNAHAVSHEKALRAADGGWFAVFAPFGAQAQAGDESALALTVFELGAPAEAGHGKLLHAADARRVVVRRSCTAAEVEERRIYGLCTNGRGAMAQVRGAWGTIHSQYDAMLAANLHPSVPVDRRVLLTRCRAWLVCRGYSQELGIACLETFEVLSRNAVRWNFRVPAGLGNAVPLSVELCLVEGRNRIELVFRRRAACGDNRLDDASPVTLIVRPDVEDRGFHEVTKAYRGPETVWRQAVTSHGSGFRFATCATHALTMRVVGGVFVQEPEWQYQVAHPLEAERGLEPSGDLFSPGYFSLSLRGGGVGLLMAEAVVPATAPEPAPAPAPEAAAAASAQRPLAEHLRDVVEQFVVARGAGATVIAGYPWFLDWGRDTFICLRGLVAAGRADAAERILGEFAAFEQNGTLPNLLAGEGDSNRDTSDGPLWFVVACRDLCEARGNKTALDRPVGRRTLREVVASIVTHVAAGTPNGIRMDDDSGLVFSPAHFTWMDTNHPAGTPREGYPIEIQALWYAVLAFAASVCAGGERWRALAARVRASIMDRYRLEGAVGLSDCLHARPGMPAAAAAADDAVRPNQLLAITLGAVDDRATCEGILAACEELLTPGAIRSLADRPVRYPQPVIDRGRMLNDPLRPYWGAYRGDEDTRRKPAYHNGTAWTWLYPSYAEALLLTYGAAMSDTVSALLGAGARLLDRDGAGHVPEILDGDSPHAARGCGAQAWGATEFLRVLLLLQRIEGGSSEAPEAKRRCG